VRALERLDELYAIGGGPGANRLGYSPAEDEAHRLAAGWMRDAGLEVASDEAGNLFGRRGAARIWSGSHLDTVPNGGKFDGALGVVAAIEAAERLADSPLAVVAFRAEETGPMGSRRLAELPIAFLEVHIEQGPRLERLGEPLGIVTGIAGQARGSVTFEGRAGHAGTTPMDERADALVAAAEFVLRVRDCARDGAVATVGALEVEPGAMNVVPARVTASVDARAPTGEQLDALIAEIGFEPAWRQDPIAMSGPPLEALRAVLPDAPELVSGAGHDAMVLAAAGVPTAMLFVRSLNGGISHSPDERSAGEDIELAVDALTEALERLAAALGE
jgi:acetylornithine deacetylase/succinyl-diaminopimelate desuccinylase-like protein